MNSYLSPVPRRRLAAMQAVTSFANRGGATLALCAILSICTTAQAQGSTTMLLTDAFGQASAWTQEGEGKSAQFTDGRVLLPALANGNSTVTPLSRFLEMPPASAYQASVRITTAADAGDDGAAGLTLIGANDTQLGVMVRPREGDVVVIHYDGKRRGGWQPPLLGYTRNAAVRGHGQPNLLSVSSRDGRLYISVNEQLVGVTRSLDFAPSAVGLRNTRTAATYEALQVQGQGMDNRLGRLLGLVKTPGARVLFADAATTTSSTVTGLFSSASSMFKGLTGSSAPEGSEAEQPPSPSKAWTPDSKDGSYRRDISRGVVVLTGTEGDDRVTARPNMLTALPGAPSFVQATIRLLTEPQDTDGPGIYAEGDVFSSTGKTRDRVAVQLNAKDLDLIWYDSASNKRTTLDSVDVPARADKAPVQIRLVLSGQQAIVFLDGRWITSVALPRSLALYRAGVRVDGKTTAEFSEFTAAEL